MNLYPFFRDLMFRLDAETAHELGLNSLKWLEFIGLLKLLLPKPLVIQQWRLCKGVHQVLSRLWAWILPIRLGWRRG